MLAKQIDVPEIGTVNFYKRRGSRSIRLSLATDGSLRVSMPTWAPYRTALDFVLSKKSWVLIQQSKAQSLLEHGQAVGKAHHLVFVPSLKHDKAASRVKQNQILIFHPAHLNFSDKNLQTIASKACLKALKKEADQLLPLRLQELAAKHGFDYGQVSTRNLKSRWGSCNQSRDITLNIFLMQLPWHLIDYVILHELTHTKVMRHGPPFWQELERHLPNAKALRKEITTFNTNLSTRA